MTQSSNSSDQTSSTVYQITGFEALGYVVEEYLGLFLVTGIGWLIWQSGTVILARTLTISDLGLLLSAPLFGIAITLIGIIIVMSGIVAIIYKLFNDITLE